MSLFHLVWSPGDMDHSRKECRLQIHSSFWQALPALLVLSWSVFTGCVFSGWSEKEETEWEGGCLATWQDRGHWAQTGDQLLNSGLLPPLVRAFIFTQSNKPSNSYCTQTNQTERMQIPKAGVWVQGMPSADSTTWDESFDPLSLFSFTSNVNYILYMPCRFAVRIQ